MRHRKLVVMIKEPRPGRVKTRLGQEIGMVNSAWWFRHQTGALLRRLRDRRWELVLAVSPDVEGMRSRIWPGDLRRIQQGQGTLGDRMARIFHAERPAATVIVGSDIPDIRSPHIARAFEVLGSNDAVLGPAVDGGYWLIGFRHGATLRPAMLQGVRWSTQHAMQDTVDRFGCSRIAYIDQLRDIDTASDLRAQG